VQLATANARVWPPDTPAASPGRSLRARNHSRPLNVVLPEIWQYPVLAACGGFHNGGEAISACEHANVIMETEAFTRYGPGMARKLLARLSRRMSFLQKSGRVESGRLIDLQKQLW
jgi:hypothetical protein